MSGQMSVDPPVAFHFVVAFLGGWGVTDTSFQEAGGIGGEIETETYREGGENRFTHALPTGMRHPKLTLKRGVANAGYGLARWCIDTLEGGLAQRIIPRDLLLSLLDGEGNPLRCWSFQNAYPTQWTVDAFQADKNAVAIETVELTYTTCSRML